MIQLLQRKCERLKRPIYLKVNKNGRFFQSFKGLRMNEHDKKSKSNFSR